jgi:biopolymer transport protein ExbD
MIDVMLVLLIIFMVVTPHCSPASTPSAAGQNLKDHPEDEENDQVLGIDRDGTTT